MKNLTNFHEFEETGVNPLLTLLENPRSWVGLVLTLYYHGNKHTKTKPCDPSQIYLRYCDQ